VRQIATDDATRHVGEPCALRELVDAILHQAGVEMHPRASLPDDDLRRERHLDAMGMRHPPHHPLRQGHLVGRAGDVGGKELDFLLHHLETVGDEVPDLGVGVLDGTAHPRQVGQGLDAHRLPFRERPGLVVAALGFDGEQFLGGREQVVLQLSEGLQPATGLVLEGLLGLAEDLLRGAGEGVALHVVEAAHDVEGGQLREGVQERGAQLRHHVEVGTGGVDEVEQRRPVDPFSHRQDPVQVVGRLDREVQHLQPPVAAEVSQVEHGNALLGNEVDDVGASELVRLLSERTNQRVGVQGKGIDLRHRGPPLRVVPVVSTVSDMLWHSHPGAR